ncbi:acetyl-CoA C-acetyltransferase [Microbacterium sp. BE35]|uniref:thiolase family protein n=1 Tax=Microbacterium sp. BE35 TaxID=2817773 RepID=UPI00285AB1F2|nr:thiolase family protein [Microbacterium sp. BE35]MDR7188227.1 acetyl-CoA C-acetyltransferase [Microbacterium sp. BE35]
MERVVIVDGARTPVGGFGGSLKDVPAHELGAIAVGAAIERAGVVGHNVDEVIMGCVGQVGKDAYNARRVAIAAGLPIDTPALNVNRLCGSGLQAVWSAAMQIAWGESQLIVAGGNESMSRLPFLDENARDGYRLADRVLLDGTRAVLTDPWTNSLMGVTAEAVATRFGISRAAQDEFAIESQRRAATDAARAAFAEEITPVEVGGRRPHIVDVDEHPRPDTTLEKLGTLRPAFAEDGTVTAGNSSGINDGAAALVVTSEGYAKEHGLRPLAAIDSVSTAALEPEIMGYAPTLALRKLFAKTGRSAANVDVVELNEAFASQALAVIRDADLDPEKTNPYGGAIALGHPVGATGAILTVRAIKDLVRRDLQSAIVTLCIGGGQGLAMLLSRYED